MILSQSDQERVVAMTRQGVPTREIAAILGVCERTITRIRVQAGCARKYQPITPENLKLARNLLEDGASYSEVARTIGCSHERLSTRFPGYGMSSSGGGQMKALMDEMHRLENE